MAAAFAAARFLTTTRNPAQSAGLVCGARLRAPLRRIVLEPGAVDSGLFLEPETSYPIHAAALPAIRLVKDIAELRTTVPRYQREMLVFLARRNETTVDEVLARELEDVACAHVEELATIPGFEAAMRWPAVEGSRHRLSASHLSLATKRDGLRAKGCARRRAQQNSPALRAG